MLTEEVPDSEETNEDPAVFEPEGPEGKVEIMVVMKLLAGLTVLLLELGSILFVEVIAIFLEKLLEESDAISDDWDVIVMLLSELLEEEVSMSFVGILVLMLVNGADTEVLDVELTEGLVDMPVMLESGLFEAFDDRFTEEPEGEAVEVELMWTESATTLELETDAVDLDLRYLEYAFWRFLRFMKGYIG